VAAATAAKLIERMLANMRHVQRGCHGEAFPDGEGSPLAEFIAPAGSAQLTRRADRRTRRPGQVGVKAPAAVSGIIGYLRRHRVTVTRDQAAVTQLAGTAGEQGHCIVAGEFAKVP
jgi:hypothetical protein